MSAGTLVFAGALVASATGAFFSDIETSNGNTFTAGSIDLSVGSNFTSLANGSGSVALTNDVNGAVLYTFTDLKPGDSGEGAFPLSVSSNEAYACARSTIDSMPDNGINEPEGEAGDITDGADAGELQNFLQFAIYADQNSNNQYDLGEPLNVNQFGGDSNGFTAAEISAAGWIPVADPTAPNTWLTIASLTPSTTYNAGFMYCFGNFDSDGDCNLVANPSDNLAQTDGVGGSIEFMAVQTRNNGVFSCSELN